MLIKASLALTVAADNSNLSVLVVSILSDIPLIIYAIISPTVFVAVLVKLILRKLNGAASQGNSPSSAKASFAVTLIIAPKDKSYSWAIW